jgi:hypothetical protein
MRCATPLLLLLGLLALSGCEGDPASMPSVPLRTATAIERRATLSMLRRAWEERADAHGDEQRWQERRIINRLGAFGKKVVQTETYRPACRLWLECVRSHEERYGRQPE